MSIVSTLIDKARQRAGIASDSALAAQFGVHRQAVSKWRNGDAYPDEEHIAEMAVMAGDDPVQWLVAIKAIRAEGKAGKAWAALAKRLATAAMVVLLAVGFTLPRDVQAMPQAGNALHDIHYAKSSIRRIWAFVGSAWQWLGLLTKHVNLLPSAMTATTETPQIPQLSARISPQGRPRFPDLPQRCP